MELIRQLSINKYAITFLFIGIYSMNMSSQADGILTLQRVEGIDFDGRVNEEVWESITPLPLVQYSPDAGSPPTEKTEIRFAYNDKYLFASIRAFDRNPKGIRGNSLYRDRLAGSDHFEILIDSYNDNETAFIFNTISTGVRTDAAIANDATGGTISSSAWLNSSFNTFWDTKVSRDEEGWYAETRIPFSSLRFQNVDGDVIMGITVQRKIARKLERLVFPAIPPEFDWAFLKPSLAQKVLLKGVEPIKKVYVSPYILTGIKRTHILDQDQQSYQWDTEFEREIGGDVKFSITNNVTMDFTVNTDFAQVEADDQLINLSRFSLFFPEKRQFFQERSAVFEFRTGGLSRLFFSRRIGLTEGGSPVPIIGGLRLVGRADTWDFGVLNMQTRNFEDLRSENFGVFRVKRRIINENSTLGGIFTSRVERNGRRNFVYGIDGLIRLFGDDYLTANWSQTFDSETEDTPTDGSLDNARLTIELNRRKRFGLGYNIGFIYSGEQYLPGIGFVDRNDFKFGTANISQTWLYPEGSAFISQRIEAEGFSYFDNESGDVISAEFGSKWSFTNRTLDGGQVGIKWIYENLTEKFVLSENAVVPAGIYRFGRYSASYNMAGEKILRTGIMIETGKFYDGWLNTITFTPSWFVSKHLELGLQYSYNQANFSERDEKLNIHITRLKIGTAVNSQISTNAFFQYNSDADLFSANVRFRYNLREGNDLWIVLNEGLNTNRLSRTPNLPLSSAESLLVKYVHTFL